MKYFILILTCFILSIGYSQTNTDSIVDPWLLPVIEEPVLTNMIYVRVSGLAYKDRINAFGSFGAQIMIHGTGDNIGLIAGIRSDFSRALDKKINTHRDFEFWEPYQQFAYMTSIVDYIQITLPAQPDLIYVNLGFESILTVPDLAAIYAGPSIRLFKGKCVIIIYGAYMPFQRYDKLYATLNASYKIN